jgi:anti-sigma regulatory factor (Ser/Thr protein kinase)
VSPPVASGSGRIRPDEQPTAVTTMPRETSTVRRAREWLRSFAARVGLRDIVRQDAELVVSELVTNALEHGQGEVELRVSLAGDGALRLAVTSGGEGTPTLLERDPGRIGGVGLHIVDDLADEWGCSPFPGGSTVWAVLGAPA